MKRIPASPFFPVIPAKAGISRLNARQIPAFAGMTAMVLALFCISLFFCSNCLANLRDPTRPENFQESQANPVQAWGLQAIIISKRHKLAIFDGRTLYLGSHLSGFTVVEITANAVHLEGPDGKMTLFLFNQTIKKAANRRT